MRTQPLSDLPCSLYRGCVTDSEADCSSDSSADEVDSDSGYGIGGGRPATCRCAARPSPVHVDDCTSTSLSQSDRMLLEPSPLSASATWTPSTARREVVDTRQVATSTQRHHDNARSVNVDLNTPVSRSGLQLTVQPASAPAVSTVVIHVRKNTFKNVKNVFFLRKKIKNVCKRE